MSLLGGLGGTVVGSAVYEIRGDITKLQSDLAASNAAVVKAGANSEAALLASAKRMMITGGVMIGAAAFIARGAVHATEQWGEGVRTLSIQLGISAQKASDLAYAGEHLGIGVDTLSKSFGIFEKHLFANDKAAKELGVTYRDSSGNLLPFDVILGRVADKFASMPNGIDKTGLALTEFGRGGKALIPLLDLGAQGLAALAAGARKYGLELNGDGLEAIHRFKLAQNDLGLAWKGAEVQLGTALMPMLTGFFGVLRGGVGLIEKIPAPVRAFGVELLFVGGTVRLAAGALMWLGTTETAVAIRTFGLAEGLQYLNLSMGTVGKATLAVGAGLLAYKGTLWLLNEVSGRTSERHQILAGSIGSVSNALWSLGPAGRQYSATFDQMAAHGQYSQEQIDKITAALGDQGLRGKIQEAAKSGADLGMLFDEIASGVDPTTALVDAMAGVDVATTQATTKVRLFAGMTATELASWKKNAVGNLNFVGDALQTLGGKAKLSAGDVLAAFTKQLKAEQDYKKNFDELIRRGLPAQFAKQIADMGTQGAGIVAALAGANKAQFAKIVATWRSAGGDANSLVGDITAIQNAINALPSQKTIHIGVTRSLSDVTNATAPKKGPGKASGGYVWPYTDYPVNENGQEILHMGSSGGYVIPSARAGNPGRTINIHGDIHINVDGGEDPRAVALEVYDQLAAKMDLIERTG